MKKVYLSNSLQDHNVGVGDYGTEMHRMYDVAQAAAKYLRQAGVATRLPNQSWAYLDPNVELFRVVKDSNDWGADLHICIHTNAASSPAAAGTVVGYMKGSTKGHKIALAVLDKVAPLSPGADHGLTTAWNFYEIRATTAPCAYAELAFHTNKADAQSVIDHTDAYGKALAEACLDYFGIKYPWAVPTKPPSAPPSPPKKKATLAWWLGWLKKNFGAK